jgi:hypothetical protein
MDPLVASGGMIELTADLGWTRAVHAIALAKVGRRRPAESEAREAVRLLKQEASRTRRADVQDRLKTITRDLGGLLR